MKMVLPRLMALVVMLFVIGAAHELRLAGFEHPEWMLLPPPVWQPF
jgi:hypothetical protein